MDPGCEDRWEQAAYGLGQRGPTHIVCNVSLSQLAVGVVPPTPTPASAPPTPTPDSISYSPAPSQGGSPDGLEGGILVNRAAIVRGSDEPVFRDRLSIQMDVRDPDAASGLGIKAVEFTIRNDDTGDEYYFHRDECPLLSLRQSGQDL